MGDETFLILQMMLCSIGLNVKTQTVCVQDGGVVDCTLNYTLPRYFFVIVGSTVSAMPSSQQCLCVTNITDLEKRWILKIVSELQQIEC